MGFKQRERKRKRRAAVRSAQQRSRDSGSSAGKWWLTITTRKCCCAVVDCGVILPEGTEVVYRHEPRETRCVRCAERLEDSRSYRTALRWERVMAKRRQMTLRRAA